MAKIYRKEQKYGQTLVAADAAEKIDTERTDAHYLRGRIPLQLGRKQEAKKGLAAGVDIDNQHRSARQNQMETGSVPAPELMQDTQ